MSTATRGRSIRPAAPPRPPGVRAGTARHLTVLAPGALSVLLGLWGIRRQGTLWQDEAVTYDMAHRSLPDLWATLGTADVVHGLYYLLMHAVFRLWDGGLVALRLPSVLAMAGATVGVAALGRRLAGARAGLLAGTVFALLPAVQRYAQEGRSYALVTALVVAQTWVLLRACAERRGLWWTGYAALAVLSALLHEFALPALAAHGTTLLVARQPRAVLKAWAGACCCAVAAVTPLVLLSMRQSGQVAWIEVSVRGDVVSFLLIAGAGPAAARVHRRAGAHRALGELALPLLLVPPASLLLASAIKPLYVDRYVLYAEAGLALLVGAALDTLWRSVRLRAVLALAAAAAVLVAVGPVGTHLRGPTSRTDDVTAVSDAVRDTVAPGEGVLFLPASRRVWLLGQGPAPYGAHDLALAAAPHSSHTLYGTELPPKDIRNRMVRAPRIVVVREPARERHERSAREEMKEATLRDHFTRCARKTIRSARIEVYERGDHC
ncbi:glycosyltransferase family 39 protein [Streptomyces sp. HUAS TT20]|uniref:glycosyltransferase family 39 protein n=1 Tax=Streptomyces sp. HUAS TT20 TaxID=3447509 RepID=UPI0021D99CD0|nr:glycosyltransferase family 39 protein [Streptomyces sp. HUAS 15-9]UXY27288.1 glycosyltransferase family 39 protein [Streptomyces sp. HUAS 15-9]